MAAGGVLAVDPKRAVEPLGIEVSKRGEDVRVIALLHEQFVTGAGKLKNINNLKDLRDPEVNNALCHRADFQVVLVRRS